MGMVGAVALAARYGFRRAPRERIPDDISPAIFATRVAETTFGEMVYHISGDGDPVVFLHGIYLGASSYEWSKVYPRFTMGREIIAPDLIGFGESERPGATMDATDYAESLVEFLRGTCGDRPPVLVASGLTAGIVLLMASRHPDRVERLILLLPTGLKESSKWSPAGMVALVGLPGLNRFVYRNYLSRAPFIRGWLTKFALGDPSRVNEEMVRALTTCAQQPARACHLRISSRQLAFDIESRLDRCRILWRPLTALRAFSLGRRRDFMEAEARRLIPVPDASSRGVRRRRVTRSSRRNSTTTFVLRAQRIAVRHLPSSVNVSDLREILNTFPVPGACVCHCHRRQVIASDNFPTSCWTLRCCVPERQSRSRAWSGLRFLGWRTGVSS
jgi:haloalkane dehalogenase